MRPVVATLLNDVLDFYAEAGAPLSYRPSVREIEARDPREMRMVARIGRRVKATATDRPSLSRTYARCRTTTLWREVYGLRCSAEAAAELNRVARVREVIRPPEPPAADILLFPSFAWSGSAAFLMAHEVWHLIEAERGLLVEAEPIREGTATFAAVKFLESSEREKYLYPPEDCGDIVSLRRAGVGWIVAGAVGASRRPLVKLLRLDVRRDLVNETMRRCVPRVVEIAESVHKDRGYVEDFRRYVRRCLAPSNLSNAVSRDHIVEAFRQLGARTLAGELVDQDLSRLVGDLHEYGLDPAAAAMARS